MAFPLESDCHAGAKAETPINKNYVVNITKKSKEAPPTLVCYIVENYKYDELLDKILIRKL